MDESGVRASGPGRPTLLGRYAVFLYKVFAQVLPLGRHLRIEFERMPAQAHINVMSPEITAACSMTWMAVCWLAYNRTDVSSKAIVPTQLPRQRSVVSLMRSDQSK